MVFISYSHQDYEFVRKLVSDLEAHDLQVWWDKGRLKPGVKWEDAIQQALGACTKMVVVLSPSSVESREVTNEYNFVLGRDGVDVIPVICSTCEKPYRLSTLQWVDLSQNDADHFARLVEVLGGHVRPLNTWELLLRKLGGYRRALGGFVNRNTLAFKLLAFVLACITITITDGMVRDNLDDVVAGQRRFNQLTGYSHMVTEGPNDPSRVSIVSVDRSKANVTTGCDFRDYLGTLLRVLAAGPFTPHVVVLDMSFSPRGCADDAKETGSLFDGAAALCRKGVGVVVGRNTDVHSQETQNDSFYLEKSLGFSSVGTGCVAEGLIDLDPDFRRLNLVFQDTKQVNEPKTQYGDSLAYAAVVRSDPKLDFSKWLPPSPSARPYVALPYPQEFEGRTVDAGTLVCGVNKSWKPCADQQRSEDRSRKKILSSSIVIVADKAEEKPDQKKDTINGQTPGYVLQASYIQSLLNQRLFSPAPDWFEWFTGGLVFLCFEYLVWGRSLVSAIPILLAIAVLVEAAMYGSVTWRHLYFNPLPASCLAIVFSRAFDLVRREL